MKLTKPILAGICALLVPISLHAADEHDEHAGLDHAKEGEHAGHDKDGDEHAKDEHAGHDKDGDEHAKDEHAGHNHAAKVAGPNGGKVFMSVEPHAEFFVTKDRKVQITFLDHENKVVPAAEQTVRAICGERSAPTRLTFTKKDGVLISDKPLPAGKNIPTVLQIKAKSGAKPVMERFNLNLNDCPGCDYLEYACTCTEH
jgi:hypothetical protein